MISTTLDDAGIFFDRFDMTEQELSDTLSASFGAKAASLHKTYREHFPARSPYLLYAQLMTDLGFARLAHAQAENRASRQGAPIYKYLWEWTCPAFDGKFGALHAMDVAASLYNERDGILGSGGRDATCMCETLSSALLAFAKKGDPNNSSIPNWPRFDVSQRATLVFDRHTRIEQDPHGALRRLWADTPMPAGVLG
jgi:para-nitrobenzyl esterase